NSPGKPGGTPPTREGAPDRKGERHRSSVSRPLGREWMWAAVKATGDPAPSLDRPVETGLRTSLPRNAGPRMLVIRTSTASAAKAGGPVSRVSLTRSPATSPRMSSRSTTSSMPTARRFSSMFSISTRFPMIGSFARPGRSRRRRPARGAKASPDRLLIPPGERRGGRGDVAVPVSDQEITVSDVDRPGFRADEDVDPVVVLPESPDLDPLQVAGPAKGVQDVLADDGVELPAVLGLLSRLLLNLLFRRHCLFRDC